MAARGKLSERLFIGLCLLLAAAVVVLGAARGNLRGGLIGAGILVGYAAVRWVSGRLLPAARLTTGRGATSEEQRVQARATVITGQFTALVAAAGVLLFAGAQWTPGLWIAIGAALPVLLYVVVLVTLTRRGQ